jgi:hypothetical protein
VPAGRTCSDVEEVERDDQGDEGAQDCHDADPWHVGELCDHVANNEDEQPRQRQVQDRRITTGVEADRAILGDVTLTADGGAGEHSEDGKNRHENPRELNENSLFQRG